MRVRPSSSRTTSASGSAAHDRASPGRPSATRARRAAVGASATPSSTRIASMSRTPDRPEADPGAARADGRQQAVLAIGAQDEDDARGRLLEGLEQGRLGVLVHALGGLDDADAGPALDGQQGQLGDEVAHPADLAARPADADLAAGAVRAEAMDVGMVAGADEPARTAGPARALGDRGRTEQAGGEVRGQGRLAHAGRTDEEHGVRDPPGDHRRDGGDGGWMAPRPGAGTHRLSRRRSRRPSCGWCGSWAWPRPRRPEPSSVAAALAVLALVVRVDRVLGLASASAAGASSVVGGLGRGRSSSDAWAWPRLPRSGRPPRWRSPRSPARRRRPWSSASCAASAWPRARPRRPPCSAGRSRPAWPRPAPEASPRAPAGPRSTARSTSRAGRHRGPDGHSARTAAARGGIAIRGRPSRRAAPPGSRSGR